MNILITNACGRRCAFCFAREKIGQAKGAAARHMSLTQLDAVMDFLELSGDRRLRLLGGEPTLHPQLEELVGRALARDFHVHLFSNCMMPEKTADFLAAVPPDRLSLLANLSPNPLDSAALKTRVAHALERLGPRAQPGITVYSPDFDYHPLIDLINRYKLRRRIRVGIAQPIVGRENAFLRPELYRETGRALVRMALDCEREDILIGFDCGLTLCMFEGDDFAVLARRSEGFRSLCRPILDLGLDAAGRLMVWHCFPLSGLMNAPLADFPNRAALERHFQKKTAAYKSFGCMPACMDCAFLRRGQCAGGCLAHAIRSFGPHGAVA